VRALAGSQLYQLSVLDGAGIGNLPGYLIEEDLRAGRHALLANNRLIN
jgi:hypothetical protein